jgi:para-nitrobenzyl esterase
MQDRYALADAEKTGIALSTALPGRPGLAALRGMSSRDIWDTALRSLPGHDYAPVIDGTSVIEGPAAANSKHGIAHDLLVGSNQDEWYMYVDDDPRGLASDLDAFAPSARAALEARAAQEPDVRTARDKTGTLVNMVCPSYLMAGAARAAGRSAWAYRFTRVRPGPGGVALRSYHGAEIPYVFDTHDAWFPRDAADAALTTRMIEFWSNFARYGNPNGPRGAAWPPFDPRNPRVMELGNRIGPLPAADHDLCRQWAGELYPGWARH